jgi:hypothetical protein
MADKGPLWREIAARHGLIESDLGKLVGWGFGDFIFHTETDVISDVNKIQRFGFAERMDSSASLTAALDSLKRKRALPWATLQTTAVIASSHRPPADPEG